MALYIKDPTVDALAEKVQALLGVSTKTEAVRESLQQTFAKLNTQPRRKFNLERARALIDAMGPADPNFDMKKFSDELYED